MAEWIDWLNVKVLQKAVIVDGAGNMLALRRTETGPGSRLGKWDLPGGSIGLSDLDEEKPCPAAIRREISEETGLAVLTPQVIFTDWWVFSRSPGKILGLAYGYVALVQGIKPAIKLSYEHVDSKWGTKDELLSLDYGDDGGMHVSILNSVAKLEPIAQSPDHE